MVKALEDLGFKGKVETNAEAKNLFGYQGDQREQTAEVILRRQHVGMSSNDIGFKKEADGTFGFVISDYDKSRYNNTWTDKLTQRYSYHKLKEQVASQGYDLVEETEENGDIFLTIHATTFGG